MVPRAFFFATLLLLAPALHAAEPTELTGLKEDMEKIVAKRMVDLIKGENQSAIAVGSFNAQDPKNNAGPGIRQQLVDALQKTKELAVVDKASMILSGAYQIVRDRTDTNQIVLLLTLTLVNDFGEELANEKFRVKNNRDIAITAGMTGTIPQGGFKDERNKHIKDQVQSPRVFIEGTRIKTSAGSKYAVEILSKRVNDRGSAQARTAHEQGGQAFVPLANDDVYELAIHNQDTREIGVAVTIDGFSVFEFSDVRTPEGKPAYTHFIVPPGESTRVVGWHKNDSGQDNFLSFLVTEYGKGASAKAAQPSQGTTGVVTVAVSYTSTGTRSAGQETGFGPPRSVQVQKVERNIDLPHEVISVRYAK